MKDLKGDVATGQGHVTYFLIKKAFEIDQFTYKYS